MEFLFIGLLLGLSSGISPGPLLTLVIAETLRYGLGAGIRVAITPFITDLPIILLTLWDRTADHGVRLPDGEGGSDGRRGSKV